ncbi:hypothetical protein [Buttiauxella agrestis]|uniref:hypothetical protein n=1 Tax=Buttiauxella agrestis TaxID=82977 RepID=UPI000F957C7E
MLTTVSKPITDTDVQAENYTEELVFSSDKKITLRCGKSSITLYPNGKITLKGEYILSDAEGINRLSGGRVDIN